MKAPFLIGRILFGGFFLYNGINHLRSAKDMAPYAGAKGVPAPELAVKLGTAQPARPLPCASTPTCSAGSANRAATRPALTPSCAPT